MDWLDIFLEYTDGLPSPDIFRKWSGITCIAGALERRVWVATARSLIFPNLFTVLVAPPAVGKSQAIYPTASLWKEIKKLHVAPDNVTKAALVDSLNHALTERATPDGLFSYHSMVVPSSEFGVLVPAHDLEFLNVLNHIYDCPPQYREERRSLSKQIDIAQPQLTILAGTQPGYLASILPEEAWSMGFTSRLLMIYSSTPKVVELFDDEFTPRKLEHQGLLEGLDRMHRLFGGFAWEDEAKAEISRWNRVGCPPVPEHSKLQHYNGRRLLHTIKLSMVSAVARDQNQLLITMEDLTRARDWLFEAEQLMPDIFRDMAGRSDGQVLQDLHYFMWKKFVKDKKPFHKSMLYHFLSTRVPSEKIDKILETAERSNMISRVAGTTDVYTPRPLAEHGME